MCKSASKSTNYMNRGCARLVGLPLQPLSSGSFKPNSLHTNWKPHRGQSKAMSPASSPPRLRKMQPYQVTKQLHLPCVYIWWYFFYNNRTHLVHSNQTTSSHGLGAKSWLKPSHSYPCSLVRFSDLTPHHDKNQHFDYVINRGSTFH